VLVYSALFLKVPILKKNPHRQNIRKNQTQAWGIFQNLHTPNQVMDIESKFLKLFLPFRQSYQAPGVGDCLRQQLGSRLAWTLTASQPSLQSTTSKGFSNAVSRGVPRSRREGDTSGKQRCIC